MSERIRNLVAVGLIASCLAVIVGLLATSPGSDADRVHALATRLKCPACESESIADSPADLARNLLDLIEEQVADGWTDEQVVEFFVATYGEEVLLDPPATGRAAILWMLPIVAAGIGVMIVVGRRAPAGATTLDDAARRRVEAALAEREQA